MVVSSKNIGLVHTLSSPYAMDGFGCLFASFVNLTQAETIQEDRIPLEELPLPDLSVGKTVGTFSWMTVETGRSSSLSGAVPSPGRWSWVLWKIRRRKLQRQTRNQNPPWSLHSSCLQDSTLNSCHDFSREGSCPIGQTKQRLSILCWYWSCFLCKQRNSKWNSERCQDLTSLCADVLVVGEEDQ